MVPTYDFVVPVPLPPVAEARAAGVAERERPVTPAFMWLNLVQIWWVSVRFQLTLTS